MTKGNLWRKEFICELHFQRGMISSWKQGTVASDRHGDGNRKFRNCIFNCEPKTERLQTVRVSPHWNGSSSQTESLHSLSKQHHQLGAQGPDWGSYGGHSYWNHYTSIKPTVNWFQSLVIYILLYSAKQKDLCNLWETQVILKTHSRIQRVSRLLRATTECLKKKGMWSPYEHGCLFSITDDRSQYWS